MDTGNLLWIMPLLAASGGIFCRFFKDPRRILIFTCNMVLGIGLLGMLAAAAVFKQGQLTASAGWFYLDALSAYHLLVLMIVYALSSFYAVNYFAADIRSGEFTPAMAQRYGTLWLASLATMIVVLIADNIGIMWVGMETTTLVTAFLVSIYPKRTAIEAMWKYLIICSVGIAFAFIGTLLVAASTSGIADAAGSRFFSWTSLRGVAGQLNPQLIKIGFLFSVVGYGTKAGLAPTHSWLPDAHSQCPTPVSAMFSGFMLNAALYCIIRHAALTNLVLGTAFFTQTVLVVFGLLSIIIAAAFILSQHDLKRLLAYHSVEHLGIIALGLGLGPVGAFAALFHTLNHSVCKALSFFSAGRLGQIYGTHDMRRISGALHVSPVWGAGLLFSLLALIGVAPFAIFISELLIVKAAIAGHAFWSLFIFIAGSSIIFVGALQHAIPMAWGKPPSLVEKPPVIKTIEVAIVFGSLAVLLFLGVWMPNGFRDVLSNAARIAGGL